MQHEELSRRLRFLAGRYSRAQWLGAIAQSRAEIEPFVVAAMTYWAIVGGDTDLHPASPPVTPILWDLFHEFRRHSAEYVLDDPITRMSPEEVKLWDFVRRMSMSQLPFGQFPSGAFGRAVCLWTGIAPRLSQGRKPKFDFQERFESFYGLKPLEWLQVAYGLYAAGNGNCNFLRKWFDDARALRMRMPEDTKVLKAFKTLVATPSEFIAIAERLRWSDRTFHSYDRNPLAQRPVIRPWEQKDIESGLDHLTAPLPHLMGNRVTAGVRDDLFGAYGDPFTEFFGNVFSAYVGELLAEGYSHWKTLSEDDLERLLKAQMKRPDWVTVCNDDVILWECKATKLGQKSAVTGVIDEETSVRRHITKAVKQFDEFERAVGERVDVENPIRLARRWWRVVVVWEPLYIGKTELQDLVGADPKHPTFVLPVEHVEFLIAAFQAGESPAETLEAVKEHGYESAIKAILDSKVPLYEKSYLRKYDQLLQDSLELSGLSDKPNPS